MKSKFHTRRGFTLVELLVVMTIIAVLAGGIFSAAQGAIKKARNAQALSIAASLSNGITQFRSEFSRWPVDTASADVRLETEATQEPLIQNLLGRQTASPLPAGYYNKRGINFIDGMPLAKNNYNGITYTANGLSGTIRDPWGQLFIILIDGDGNNNVVDPEGGTNPIWIKAGVISAGPDRTLTGQFEGVDATRDNIRSW